ncbi:hypothetical protein L1049_010244 [Liquidambar formosana]|uniref:Uncharacterized protein n=1 Tax=Liquidambar formosana TaxID=63359 RepID=A0AAP0R4P9_LIQFO
MHEHRQPLSRSIDDSVCVYIAYAFELFLCSNGFHSSSNNMKQPGRTYSPAKFRPTPLSDGLNSPNYLYPHDRKLHRGRTGKLHTTGFRVRLRKYGTSASKASGVTTPLSKWKFNDGEFTGAGSNAAVTGRRVFRRATSDGVVEHVSARKLAAGLWQWRPSAEISAGGGDAKGRGLPCGPFDRLGFVPGVGHVNMAFPTQCNGRGYGAKSKDMMLQTPSSVSGPKNEIRNKLETSLPYPKSAKEGATKWDSGCSKTSDEVYRFYTHMKLLDDQQVTTVSVISSLQAQLVQAQTCIHKLEADRKSSKKKLKHFLRKLDEEKASWRRKEHQKIRAIIDDLKDELNRERKSCQKMEIVNSKLVNELADAKSSVKQFMQEYEKERKARELMEEVCNELAKEIGEDKTEVEALKRDSIKIHDELEEERKMLQMAEVWREERVQMKLVDAKLILEEKYSHMNKLTADLETFVRSRSVTLDVMERREAESLLQAVNSVKIEDIKQFSYVPPISNDIFTLIEDLKNGETRDREIKPCMNSIVANGFNQNPMQENSNGYRDHTRGLEEDASGWDTGVTLLLTEVAKAEKFQGPGQNGTKMLVRNLQLQKSVKSAQYQPSNQSTRTSAVSKLWRSCLNDGEACKIITVEGNERLSNGSISNVGPSLQREGQVKVSSVTGIQ